MRFFVGLILSLNVGCAVCYATANDVTFYRYKDKDGTLVINNTLPPEYANSGYDIVTPRGNVIESVPPQKSPAELKQEADLQAAQAHEKRNAEKQAQQAKIQAEKDEVLLKMYSAKEDIIRTRDAKISSIEILVSITKDNIKRQTQALEEIKGRVMQIEQNNQQVSEHLKKQYQETQDNINKSTVFLNTKQQEIENIKQHYQQQIERFEYLQKSKLHQQ